MLMLRKCLAMATALFYYICLSYVSQVVINVFEMQRGKNNQ